MAKNNTDRPTSANISSSTLFHFTNSMDNLLNILENDFSPHYCLEVFTQKDDELEEYAIPMVSFCDLPLSLIKNHLNHYGKYGIGLSKAWGIAKGITPVLYIHNNSILLSLVDELHPLIKTRNAMDFELSKTIYTSYVKPYEGTAFRHGEYIKSVRFYDEREWRYVPNTKSAFDSAFLSKDIYLFSIHKKLLEEKFAQQYKLTFTPNDIHYIIVEKETEILPMIRDIEKIKGKYNLDDVRILTTRIISSERIKEDF